MAQEPNKQLPALATGGKTLAIVPQTFNEIVQVASTVLQAGMNPKSLDTTQKITVAIMHGLELGLTPMAALSSIAVVNGNAAVYGDGMIALVRASGHLEDIKESVEWGKDGPLSATCEVKRKGEASWGKHTFTRDDAIKANLWKKGGPWTQYPQRMMAMRSRAWALRDKFADVLRGLKSAEEIEDMVDITPKSPAPAEPTRADFVEKPAPETPAADTGKAPYDEKESEKAAQLEQAAAAGQVVTDVEDLNAGNGVDMNDPETWPPEWAKPGEKLEFMRYTKTAEFAEFAEDFLAKTNQEGARQFESFYDGTLIAMDRGKPATKEAASLLRATIKELIDPPDSAK